MPYRLHPFFSPEGEAALAAVLRLLPLMAFDFDGTLAPIVARPDDARIPQAIAMRLRALAARLPVAIVTGLALDGLRRLARVRAAELAAAGVIFEDKGASIALHYRLARDRMRAQALIEELLSPADPALRVFSGKMVVNVMAADAPDKAHAVQTLVARCGASAAFFAGDDVNDEPVFESAPAHWLTVRAGRDEAALRARFCIDGPRDMPMLLDRALAVLAVQGST